MSQYIIRWECFICRKFLLSRQEKIFLSAERYFEPIRIRRVSITSLFSGECVKTQIMRAESPTSPQPRATLWVYSIQLTTRPVRATICGTIELPLQQGARFYKPFHPGRCPTLYTHLPFIHIFDNSQHLTFAKEIVKSCFECCISWT